jgi:pimeloyl-ACP methyl ester carboxylesterase
LPEKQRSFALPWYITLTMRILRTFSLTLATRFALYLFFKPIPFPIPAREKPLRQKSKQHQLTTSKGKPFKVYQSGAGKRQIILIHGWSGRGTQIFKIAEKLAPHFSVLAIDAPGHGENLGSQSTMLDFVDAIDKTTETFGLIYGAVGHSLGGMALFNALEKSLSLEKLVIMGSPSTIPNVIGDFCQRTQAGPKVKVRIINYLEKRYQLKIDAVSTRNLAKKHNPPGLIFHDEDDRDVPVINAHETAQAWPNAQLHLSKELGHRRILMENSIVNRIYDFFKN